MCQKLRTSDPCDPMQLTKQSEAYWALGKDYSDDIIDSSYEWNGTALWQLIVNRVLDLRWILAGQLSDEATGIYGLMKGWKLIDDQQREALNSFTLPLAIVVIYCSPCACLIQTAFRICERISETAKEFLRVQVRPDDRIPSSCCTSSGRELALKKLLEALQTKQASIFDRWTPVRTPMIKFLDRLWLENRVNHLEYEESYHFQVYSSGYEGDVHTQAIILGEERVLSKFILENRAKFQKTPVPRRIPKESEVWNLDDFNSDTTARGFQYSSFLFSFIQRSLPKEQTKPQETAPELENPAAFTAVPTTIPTATAREDGSHIQLQSSGTKRSPSELGSESDLESSSTKRTKESVAISGLDEDGF